MNKHKLKTIINNNDKYKNLPKTPAEAMLALDALLLREKTRDTLLMSEIGKLQRKIDSVKNETLN